MRVPTVSTTRPTCRGSECPPLHKFKIRNSEAYGTEEKTYPRASLTRQARDDRWNHLIVDWSHICTARVRDRCTWTCRGTVSRYYRLHCSTERVEGVERDGHLFATYLPRGTRVQWPHVPAIQAALHPVMYKRALPFFT